MYPKLKAYSTYIFLNSIEFFERNWGDPRAAHKNRPTIQINFLNTLKSVIVQNKQMLISELFV